MRLSAFVLMVVTLSAANAQQTGTARRLPPLKVSENRRFLMTANGRPFFYLADTAWELFHRLDRKQAIEYLDKRASQRYTAIQAVALAELDGVTDPNPYGDLPLIDKNPAKPAVTPGADPANAQAYDYWDHVEYIVDQANARGMYLAFLPTWGRWVNNNGRTDESLLTPANAQGFGEFLGKRFGKKAIIWVLGGDRTPTGFEATWHAGERHRHRRFRKGGLLGGADDVSSARRRDFLDVVSRGRVAGFQHASDRARAGGEGDELGTDREGLRAESGETGD
jgi:hypothetical protein